MEQRSGLSAWRASTSRELEDMQQHTKSREGVLCKVHLGLGVVYMLVCAVLSG